MSGKQKERQRRVSRRKDGEEVPERAEVDDAGRAFVGTGGSGIWGRIHNREQCHDLICTLEITH